MSVLAETPYTGYWDHNIIHYYLEDWTMAYEVDSIPNNTEKAYVVVNAKAHAGHYKKLAKELNKVKELVLILSSDEDRLFDLNLLKENLKTPPVAVYVQYSNTNESESHISDNIYPIPCGWANSQPSDDKNVDVFFVGQITHDRRLDFAQNLSPIVNESPDLVFDLKFFENFAGDVSPIEYADKISKSKIVPAPSGAVSIESFRAYEALESVSVPILDTESSFADWAGFWEFLFCEKGVLRSMPFVQIKNYADLKGYIYDILNNFNFVQALTYVNWIRYKRLEKRKLQMLLDPTIENVAVTIPVSPIPSHPNTKILSQTIQSVRHHLPDAYIYLTFDGIREEQKKIAKDYYNHICKFLLQTQKDDRIIPYIMTDHTHQVGMYKECSIDMVEDYILYVEQDTPLVEDYDIPFQQFLKLIKSGKSNLIRLHFEAEIPNEHKNLMLGEIKDELLPTIQWSQRPHLASKAYYDRIVNTYFSSKAKTFFEDKMHGVVMSDYSSHGVNGWNQHKIHIYHPEGNIKRSLHTDGREGSEKFDKDLVF